MQGEGGKSRERMLLLTKAYSTPSDDSNPRTPEASGINSPLNLLQCAICRALNLHFMRFRSFGPTTSFCRQIPKMLELRTKKEFKVDCKSPGENGVEQSIYSPKGSRQEVIRSRVGQICTPFSSKGMQMHKTTSDTLQRKTWA